jgi:hypothetical protein
MQGVVNRFLVRSDIPSVSRILSATRHPVPSFHRLMRCTATVIFSLAALIRVISRVRVARC